jgi:hypothetical protein
MTESNKSLRPVGAADRDLGAVRRTMDAYQPRVAADLAILHEAPANVPLDVDLNLLAAVGASDRELVDMIHRVTLAECVPPRL